MTKTAITVQNLKKYFFIPDTKPKYRTSLKDLFLPKTRKLPAINDISFQVKPGERVAFIGPNGAGKSTTIKILSGIMQPSSGLVSVLGKNPNSDRKKLAYQIGAVFGQRSQLWYHLPVYETLELLAAIYDIPHTLFQKRLKELSEKFAIQNFLSKPVRQLSLGERMKCEIVASFLHNPSILFLDEPTIGLDITAKAIIRDLVRQQSIQQNATLLLTSHDTDDIEKVCDRVIIIDKGCILLDDSLINLKTRYIRKKVISIVTEEEKIDWRQITTPVEVLELTPHHLKIELDITKYTVEKLISELLETFIIKDLTIESPALETIIQSLYQQGST